MQHLRHPRRGAGVIVLFTVTALVGCGSAPRGPASSGEPTSAGEVAQEILGPGTFERKRVRAATCRQTSAGHWTCAVTFAGGATGTVLAVWYGRERVLGLSLAG
jgi:hypothetical protein